MPVGRPAPVSTNIGRLGTHDSEFWHDHNPMKRRSCEGCDANDDAQMCQVWCGALCGLKLFSGLLHKDQLTRHLFVHTPYRQLKP